jgi:tetratricopeptide (TPR) repeat protein
VSPSIIGSDPAGSDPAPARDRLRAVHGLIRGGNIPAALHSLQQLELEGRNDAHLLQAVAECYTHCTKHLDAYRCHARAVSLAPRDPRCIYNFAAAAVAIGNIEEAESLFSRVISIEPRDFDAWQNRSTLRRHSAENNHVAELERALSGIAPGHPGEVALYYALARELEDLGEYARSFACLRRGADSRRRKLSYRVEMDLEAIDQVRSAFDSSVLSSAPVPSAGPGPVFIVGLPRSGTTLVDRILSSHSAVESLGELNDLPFAVMHAAGAASDKMDLIRRTAHADFAALGREYQRRVAGYGSTKPCVIDKAPLNFLYLGLIRLALPAAKIIHLRRHPMDSGYAMYKTLFRMGYPFSYDLGDLGRYLHAYHGLMAHWRESLPGGFLDVDYEALVQDQNAQSRRIIEWCGLQWEPQCEAFHLNPAPAATASAAQVREPMHSRSVGIWRRYEQQLEPLARLLRASGVLPA